MKPESVTDRYINNLIRRGKNDTYEIERIQRDIASVDNIPVGVYFSVALSVPMEDHRQILAIGATPLAAIQRALEKDGVQLR